MLIVLSYLLILQCHIHIVHHTSLRVAYYISSDTMQVSAGDKFLHVNSSALSISMQLSAIPA